MDTSWILVIAVVSLLLWGLLLQSIIREGTYAREMRKYAVIQTKLLIEIAKKNGVEAEILTALNDRMTLSKD